MRDVSAFPYYYARIVSRQPLAPSWLRVVFVDTWGHFVNRIPLTHLLYLNLYSRCGDYAVDSCFFRKMIPNEGANCRLLPSNG